MTQEQREWADRVNEEILLIPMTKSNTSRNRAVTDIAIYHDMGCTPEETARAILGLNPRLYAKAVEISIKQEEQARI